MHGPNLKIISKIWHLECRGKAAGKHPVPQTSLGDVKTSMSSFFTVPASQRKRKRNDVAPAPITKRRNTSNGATRNQEKATTRRPDRDESISGSESEDGAGPARTSVVEDGVGSSSESDHEDETGAERRLRLAERYLENIQGEVDEAGFDAVEIDRDLIAERLKEDVVRVDCLVQMPISGLPANV